LSPSYNSTNWWQEITLNEALTPNQLLAILNYQTPENIVTATEILQNAVNGSVAQQLTPTSLAALGDIMMNECTTGLSTDAYAICRPVTGGSAGTSGWTIGVTQQDFGNNGTVAATTLEMALSAGGNSQLVAAENTIAADLGSNTVTPVEDAQGDITDYMVDGFTLSSINAALQAPNAESSLQNSTYLAINTNAHDIATQVGNLSNSSVAAALTPGNAAFDPNAYIALADFDNQFRLDPAKSPLHQVGKVYAMEFAKESFGSLQILLLSLIALASPAYGQITFQGQNVVGKTTTVVAGQLIALTYTGQAAPDATYGNFGSQGNYVSNLVITAQAPSSCPYFPAMAMPSCVTEPTNAIFGPTANFYVVTPGKHYFTFVQKTAAGQVSYKGYLDVVAPVPTVTLSGGEIGIESAGNNALILAT
jgi:hypothetical protein